MIIAMPFCRMNEKKAWKFVFMLLWGFEPQSRT